MGRISLPLSALILMMAVFLVMPCFGCKGGKAIKALAKQGVTKLRKVTVKGTKEFLKKSLVKAGKAVKNNPLEAVNTAASFGTCIASELIESCGGTCQHLQHQINQTNGSIAQTIKKMDTDMNEARRLSIEVNSLIEVSQNISTFFVKLSDIVNDTITENEQVVGISEMAKAVFNVDELARKEHIKALADGIELLTNELATKVKTTSQIENGMVYGSLGIGFGGAALSYGIRQYAMSKALKANEALLHQVGKSQLKKVLAGESLNKIYPELMTSKTGYKALKSGQRARKIATITRKVGNLMTAGATAICAAQIGLQKKSEEERIAIQKSSLNKLKKLDTDLLKTSAEIETMLKDVALATQSGVKQIYEEYGNLLKVAAKSLCSSQFTTSHSNECTHFEEHSCFINNSVSVSINEMKNLNKAINKSYNLFVVAKEQEKLKKNLKKNAEFLVTRFKDLNMNASAVCHTLKDPNSEGDFCDEIYKSGLYTGLGDWQPWINSPCSPVDCSMVQQRICPRKDCIGSSKRTVRCSEPCVPVQGRHMDAEFVKAMKAHC